MSAPAVVITLPLEGRLQVVKACCMTDGDRHRLEDWINAHPDLAALLGNAIDLERRAA